MRNLGQLVELRPEGWWKDPLGAVRRVWSGLERVYRVYYFCVGGPGRSAVRQEITNLESWERVPRRIAQAAERRSRMYAQGSVPLLDPPPREKGCPGSAPAETILPMQPVRVDPPALRIRRLILANVVLEDEDLEDEELSDAEVEELVNLLVDVGYVIGSAPGGGACYYPPSEGGQE